MIVLIIQVSIDIDINRKAISTRQLRETILSHVAARQTLNGT